MVTKKIAGAFLSVLMREAQKVNNSTYPHAAPPPPTRRTEPPTQRTYPATHCTPPGQVTATPTHPPPLPHPLPMTPPVTSYLNLPTPPPTPPPTYPPHPQTHPPQPAPVPTQKVTRESEGGIEQGAREANVYLRRMEQRPEFYDDIRELFDNYFALHGEDDEEGGQGGGGGGAGGECRARRTRCGGRYKEREGGVLKGILPGHVGCHARVCVKFVR